MSTAEREPLCTQSPVIPCPPLQATPENGTASSLPVLFKSSTTKARKITRYYRERNNAKAVLAIFINYFVIAACIGVSEIALASNQVPIIASTGIYLFSVLVISSRLRAFENLVHEASHYNLFTSSRLHDIFEPLYAFPVFRLLHDYRHSHQIHHKHLGDPARDPDLIRLRNDVLDQLPDGFFWLFFGRPLTGYLTYEYLTTTFYEFWASPSSRLSKIAYWIVIMSAIVHKKIFIYFVLYYLVPFLVVLPVTRFWAEVSEHAGLDLTEDIGNSRTNIGFLHSWFMHPHNDGYHTIHHLDSKVPFHSLPAAHNYLMQADEEFRKKVVVSRGMIETFDQMRRTKTIFMGVSTHDGFIVGMAG
jgi:fatty acid desaturase